MKNYFFICTLLCSTLYAFNVFGEDIEHHDAHEHGVVKMDLAIQNDDINISLNGAYFGFLGFEHKPNNDEQKKAYENLLNSFNKEIDDVFAFSKKADCKNTSVILKNNGMPTTNDHENLYAEFKFVCKNPQYLKDLQINLFKHFNGLHTVETQIIVNSAQKSEILNAKNNILKW